jgi:hypothetical protein
MTGAGAEGDMPGSAPMIRRLTILDGGCGLPLANLIAHCASRLAVKPSESSAIWTDKFSAAIWAANLVQGSSGILARS